ncbi:hypothetical protein HF325_004024 [Metschnikowia pulcherrima]|uniref:RNA helicase n=1 Tax=Metschnikowia pulcherrima TaxID=27326 RepID=A0A8H7GTM6_9ASCO|nr:hypothetical protein HF325_004024 [Metschnikowia pulcherrima]
MWKPVELPDNLGDYSGFFGLEELEGVDVRMVNGAPEFIAKESDDEADEKEAGVKLTKAKAKAKEKAKSKADKEIENDSKVSEESNSEAKAPAGEKAGSDDESGELEDEFTGFDDLDSESVPAPKKNTNPAAAAAGEDEELTELTFNAFTGLAMPLPDDDIDLPHWASLPLSSYTLSGLQSHGFTEPTPIQRETIPMALNGKDVIGKATTGSGKTLAYGIPILEKYIARLELLKNLKKKDVAQPPSGIIFAPTRELAHQVVHHMNEIAKFSPLAQNGIVSITGGLSVQKQERLLSYGPVRKDFGWRWQTLVFSATFSREFFGKLDRQNKKSNTTSVTGLIGNDEILELLKKKLKFKDPRPSLCDANPKEIVSGQVTEALVECGATERDLYIYYFVLNYPGSTLVFANSVDSVRRLVPLLSNLNIPAFSIHSAMMQKQRLRALERFKLSCEKNKSSVLIATDVAARGLDIPNIDHVAHYHLPRSADVYVHRSGRTARAGKEGVSVMFCSPQEALGPLKKLRKLVASSAENKRLNAHADVKLLPIDLDVLSQIRERVQLAGKLGDSSIAGTATRKESSWLKQAAEDLGIENISDVDEFEDDVIKKQRERKQRKTLTKDEQKALRAQLRQLLSKPLRSNHRRSYITSGLENLAHQIVSGNTSDTILGKKSVRALDELRGLRNRISKN